MFVLLELSLSLIRLLKRLIAKIASRDRDLARQIQRAAASVPLNVSEARRRAGGDRRHLFRVALGSAAETATALEIAVGWGYLEDAEVAKALALLDRIQAMSWRAAKAG
jgi:four helix bundle protein